MEEIFISTEWIRLGQFLKLAGIALEGAEAKSLLYDRAVKVNGHIEIRRGCKLKPEDIVEVDDGRYVVKIRP